MGGKGLALITSQFIEAGHQTTRDGDGEGANESHQELSTANRPGKDRPATSVSATNNQGIFAISASCVDVALDSLAFSPPMHGPSQGRHSPDDCRSTTSSILRTQWTQ
ncbi:hypothetical protein ACMYSQ_008016 [Aspergillus niger]